MKQAHGAASRLFFRIGGAVLLFASLSSCSLWPTLPSAGEQAEKLAETLDKGAYKPINHYEIQSKREIWLHDQTELDVVLTAPNDAGSYPLIIYLPGLGEDAEAGRVWREYWAKAGYLVFSLQAVKVAKALQALEPKPGDDGERQNSSTLPPDDIDLELPESEGHVDRSDQRHRNSRIARNSELRYLGHEYFADNNLRDRLQQLYWAYRQFKNRAAAHQAPYASADFSKVVLAGYELGAQTVAAASGETFDLQRPDANEFKPSAAIVLSPSVNLASGNAHSRFQAITLPMLAVTGTQDNDPYAISSASARTGIWDYAPAGNKFLLLLRDAGHRVLAGSELGGRFAREHSSEHRGGMFGSNSDWNRNGQSSGRYGGRRRSGMESGLAFDGIRDDSFDRDGTNKDLGYKHVAAILSVSTAFLDMQIKADEFAPSWLGGKAGTWLGTTGNLKSK